MSSYCNICDTPRPPEGTNSLVLNGGSLWIEFCPMCGETETLTNPETKEVVTIAELFRRSGGTPTPVDPQRVADCLQAKRKHKERQENASLRKACLRQLQQSKLRGGIGNQTVSYHSR
jgi:hypothetical protein